MQAITKTYKNNLSRLISKLDGIGTGLLEAGQIICEMLKEDDQVFEKIIKDCPSMTFAFLETLERIGLGKLDWRIVADPSPLAHRAMAQALPMSQQVKLLEKPIAVAVRDNGDIRIVQKRIHECNQVEATRIVGEGKIRTPEEQTHILREQIAHESQRDSRYVIDGDRIHFFKTQWTWSELSEILERFKPSADDIEASVKKNQIKA